MSYKTWIRACMAVSAWGMGGGGLAVAASPPAAPATSILRWDNVERSKTAEGLLSKDLGACGNAEFQFYCLSGVCQLTTSDGRSGRASVLMTGAVSYGARDFQAVSAAAPGLVMVGLRLFHFVAAKRNELDQDQLVTYERVPAPNLAAVVGCSKGEWIATQPRNLPATDARAAYLETLVIGLVEAARRIPPRPVKGRP